MQLQDACIWRQRQRPLGRLCSGDSHTWKNGKKGNRCAHLAAAAAPRAAAAAARRTAAAAAGARHRAAAALHSRPWAAAACRTGRHRAGAAPRKAGAGRVPCLQRRSRERGAQWGVSWESNRSVARGAGGAAWLHGMRCAAWRPRAGALAACASFLCEPQARKTST